MSRGDREVVLAAVNKDGRALEFATESCRGDREVVLAAVKKDGRALEFAFESCRGDREVVLAAVKQRGDALQFAAGSCRGDPEVVLAAVRNVPKGREALVLKWASDELLEDSSFAVEAKEECHVLKISMISGRQALVVVPRTRRYTEDIMRLCCEKLGVSSTGSMCLVSGDDVVPARTVVHDWPGIPAGGEIGEYQLVVQQS